MGNVVKPLRYGSVCSGIEAATQAWHGLGWEPAWFSEIEPFPAQVLAHHYPQVPNHGDMTRLRDWADPVTGLVTPGKLQGRDRDIDLLVGGTPCQSFSISGLRGGLSDPRGNLALEFCRLAQELRPRWVVWENVPGVLSSDGGRAFGSILGALAHLGYGLAYRVRDAQFFGVPQRRRRVFVVGYLGDWRAAATVLFEPEGVPGHPQKGKKAGEEVAGTLGGGSGSRGGAPDTERMTFLPVEIYNADGMGSEVAPCLSRSNLSKQANNQQPLAVQQPMVFDTTQITSKTNRCQPKPGNVCHPLAATGHPPSIVYAPETAGTLMANGKAAGSATQQDAESDLLVVQGLNLRPDYVPEVSACLRAGNERNNSDPTQEAQMLIAGEVCVTGRITHTLRAEGADASEDGTGRGTPIVTAMTVHATQTPITAEEMSPCLASESQIGVQTQPGLAVRRLTPRECERLQGFPDDWTLVPIGTTKAGVVKMASDSVRYRALGNSMAVPVMAWIGQRIDAVQKILDTEPDPGVGDKP